MTPNREQAERLAKKTQEAVDLYMAETKWPQITAIACHPVVAEFLRPGLTAEMEIREMPMLKATNAILASGSRIIDIISIEE